MRIQRDSGIFVICIDVLGKVLGPLASEGEVCDCLLGVTTALICLQELASPQVEAGDI